MIGSIIAFSVIVTYKGSSEYNYIMFTGISGTVISLAYMVTYCAGNKGVRGKIAAIVDALWFVFWLAAAALTTRMLTDSDTNNSRTVCSCAFSWVTWFLWTVSLGVSIREARGYEY